MNYGCDSHELLLLGGCSSGGGGHSATGLQTSYKSSKGDSSVSSSRVLHTAAPAIPLQPEVLGAFHEILSLI